MKMSMTSGLGVLLVLLASCGSAQFKGTGGGTHSNNPPSTNNPSDGTPSTNTPANPPASNPTTPPTGGNGNPNGPDSGANGPGMPGAPGHTPIPGTPGNYPGNVPQNCNGNPCSDPQTPSWGPNDEIVQTTPNSVTFAPNSVFHIGNGEFEASSCKLRLTLRPLSGTVYFFQFEVTADNTAVDIKLGRLCGVDYDTSVLQLSNGNAIANNPVAIGASSHTMAPTTLNKGVYTIYVYAGKRDNQANADVDDFIVGRVSIDANQPIRAGKYGTYQ